MSLRLKMLQAASRASYILGDSSNLVLKFLLNQQNPDGGFKNRAGQSDIYYLPFALGALAALLARDSTQGQLSAELEGCLQRTVRYLTGFGGAADLDFIHLCSLARSWAAIRQYGQEMDVSVVLTSIPARLELHRTPDGGYHPVRGAACGSTYGAFLAFGAYQDLEADIPDPLRLGESLRALQTPQAGFANELGARRAAMPASTNASAAAIAVLSELEIPPRYQAAEWLLARLHPSGGFLASETAPAPDLLSTATALHALASLEAPLKAVQERSLDFVDSLWTNQGGFYGHWADDYLDCEYAFYGLLALGHLQSA